MNTETPLLTIAIPTYNRAGALQAQLARLVPQLTPAVRLCVFDNASPDNTREVVAPYLSQGVAYSCAVANCGWGRNFFRCFEECRTEWLWMLSDDDLAGPTAVADLLAVLSRGEADFIHTSSEVRAYAEEATVTDLPAYLQRSNLGSLLYISAGIYRVPVFKPYFRLFHEAMTTMGPHMIMVLALLDSGKGRVRLSPLHLFTPPGKPPGWSTLNFVLRMSLLPEFVQQPGNQRLLAAQFYHEFFHDFILMGLRDTADLDHIRKWQRITRQATRNLKAYGVPAAWGFAFRNWFRPGRRKASWHLVRRAFPVDVLSLCPTGWFHPLARILPLGKDVRELYYNQRKDFVPYV